MLLRVLFIEILLIISEFLLCCEAVDLEKAFRENKRRIKVNVNEYFDTLQPAIGPFLKNAGFDPIELPRVEEKLAGQLLYSLYTGKIILLNGTLSDFSDIRRNGDAFVLYDNKTLQARGGIAIRNVNFRYDYVVDLVVLQYYGRVIGTANNIVATGTVTVNLNSYDLRLDRLDIATKGRLNVYFEGNVLLDWIWNAATKIVTEVFKQQLSEIITIRAREYISVLLTRFKDKDEDNQIKEVSNLVLFTVG